MWKLWNVWATSLLRYSSFHTFTSCCVLHICSTKIDIVCLMANSNKWMCDIYWNNLQQKGIVFCYTFHRSKTTVYCCFSSSRKLTTGSVQNRWLGCKTSKTFSFTCSSFNAIFTYCWHSFSNYSYSIDFDEIWLTFLLILSVCQWAKKLF